MTVLTLLFALSGAAGLIYESIWTRYLSLLVGHSAYAQVLVLVIFLGGMAIGALIIGRRSERIANPLLGYAVTELAVGVLGAVFHPVFIAVSNAAYDRWFPAIGEGPMLVAVQWTIAALLILPQSIFLGMTFPLMSAGVMRLRRTSAGHSLGLLYFSNSLGAAAGVMIEGFFLIGRYGFAGTLRAAAIINAVVAVAVFLFRFRRNSVPVVNQNAVVDDAVIENAVVENAGLVSAVSSSALWRALLAVSAGTALASFIYEIAWIRMLSLVLGAATHSFEIMLSAFILGLAAGAYWIRKRIDDEARPLKLLGQVQWAMGLLAVATLPVYLLTFRMMSVAIETFQRSDSGYIAFSVVRYGLALLVMLPATFCAGMTLPLITKVLVGAGHGERSIGAVYGANTIGSIVGAALAGLVLMPVLGLKWLLIAGAILDIGIGLALVTWDDRLFGLRPAEAERLKRMKIAAPSGPQTAAVLTTAFIGAVAILARFDRSVITGGVYRHASVPSPGAYDFLHHRDGRTATVSLRRAHGDTNAMMTLATNGKPDASVASRWRRPATDTTVPLPLEEDMSSQLLLPIISLAHAPTAKHVAIVGQGSGMTSHFLLASPNLETLETIEIEPEMVRASRGFMPANRRVFEDPRSRFVFDDARSFLSATGRAYDVILSEPSNPWVSGVSGLFTVEFYQRVAKKLAPRGVFAQWLHLYEINDDLVVSVLSAADRVFPAYDIYLTSNADLVILASMGTAVPAPDWSIVHWPMFADELRRVHPILPEQLETLRFANRQLLHSYLAWEKPNSDFNPILDLGAEATRFRHDLGTGVSQLADAYFDPTAMLDKRRRHFGTSGTTPIPDIARPAGLATSTILREALSRQPVDTSVLPADVRPALYRHQTFMRALRDRERPADWHSWVDDFLAVMQKLHLGTAGVADEEFFGAVTAYVGAVNAPAPVVASVDLMHGIAAWNHPQTIAAANVLLEERARDEKSWLPIDLIRDGAVVAYLATGDVKDAREVYRKTRTFSQPVNVRHRALSSLVQALDRSSLSGGLVAPGRLPR